MPHVLAQDLRNAVLQAAFEGRLTSREKSDSNIYVALKGNSSIRNRKIAEKEIKKDSILPIDETPFEVPDEWMWVRFSEIFSVLNGDRGKNYPAKNTLKKTGIIPFISALNLNGKDVTVDDNLLYLSEEQYEKLNAGKLKTNDTVMCIRGSLGKHGKFQFEKGAIASSLVIIRHISDICDDKYLFYYLDSPLLTAEIRKYDNGTAQPNLAADSLKKFLFPLPPIEEQARIVTRVDELMAKIDKYEKIEKELTELQKAFPGNMKDAILQAAMQGKLTEQLESDGDVFEFVKEISIKDKKWKPINEDDLPFSIPDSWDWMRLREFSSIAAGGTPNRSEPKYWNGNIPWLKIGNLTSKYVTEADEFITEDGLKNSSAKWVKKGTILYSIFASIGTVAILDFDATTNQAIAAVTVNDRMNRDYMYYVLTALKSVLVGQGHGMAQMNINQEILKNTPIPIPPIEEQQRIVDKLDQLLPLCESLEAMI